MLPNNENRYAFSHSNVLRQYFFMLKALNETQTQHKKYYGNNNVTILQIEPNTISQSLLTSRYMPAFKQFAV